MLKNMLLYAAGEFDTRNPYWIEMLALQSFIIIEPLSGPLFTKRWDVLPPHLVKSRSREIGCYNDRIALKFDRHLGSAAVEVPFKFRNDW